MINTLVAILISITTTTTYTNVEIFHPNKTKQITTNCTCTISPLKTKLTITCNKKKYSGTYYLTNNNQYTPSTTNPKRLRQKTKPFKFGLYTIIPLSSNRYARIHHR